jgi:hypothetical protein
MPTRTPSSQTKSKAGTNAVDPRLSDVAIKSEPRTTPPPLMLNPFMFHQPYVSRMQLWSSASPNSFGNASTEYDWPNDSDLYGASSLYATTANSSANTSAVIDDNEEQGNVECTRLKGVYWPGMDLFDSATPEMKRKRNQKKDISVVEQLELNSKEVEPTELIFTPLGSFKRQRRISGSTFDESSPIKEELSPQPRRFVRPALMELDPNKQNHSRIGFCELRARSAFRNTEDEQTEQKTLHSDIFSSRKPCPFEIFQDQAVTYAQPASFNYLASEFRYPQPPDFNTVKKQAKQPYAPRWEFEEKENYGAIAYQYANYLPHNVSRNTQMPIHGASSLNQDAAPGFFANPFPTFSTYQPMEPDIDDQETITAPPSEI